RTSDVDPLLHSEPATPRLETPKPYLRDTYSEFAGGIWRYLIRAKRAYRRMGPPPAILYGKKAQSVNERVGESAIRFFEDLNDYCPPNLWEYLRRTGQTKKASPRHKYLGSAKDNSLLLIWLVAAGFGAYAMTSWIRPAVVPQAHPAIFAVAVVVAVALLVFGLDWIESHLNHQHALDPDGPAASRRSSLLAVIVPFRIIALLPLVWGALLR